MFQVSFDWVLNAAQGILAAGWGLMAWLYFRLDRRVTAVENASVKAEAFAALTGQVNRIAADVHTLTRVLYAVAHKLNVGDMADPLNGRDT